MVKLKINNYGVSISTLEEVFMKVGNLIDLTELEPKNNNSAENPRRDDAETDI